MERPNIKDFFPDKTLKEMMLIYKNSESLFSYVKELDKYIDYISSQLEPPVSDDFGGQPLKITGDELNTLIDLLEIFYDDHYDKLHTKLMNKKYEIVNNISQNSR